MICLEIGSRTIHPNSISFFGKSVRLSIFFLTFFSIVYDFFNNVRLE